MTKDLYLPNNVGCNGVRPKYVWQTVKLQAVVKDLQAQNCNLA